jgi:hypothetical protein
MIEIVKGLVTGLLIGILIFYSLRPKTPYPSWMIAPYEHPWVFIILLGLVFYLIMWDRVVGALSFIVVAALLLDLHLLGRKTIASKHDIDLMHASDVVNHGLVVDDYPEVYELETVDTSGVPLQSVSIDEPVYPMFQDNDMDFAPGQPSPF